MAYAFWVHKNAPPKNWLMRVRGLIFYKRDRDNLGKQMSTTKLQWPVLKYGDTYLLVLV